MSQILCVLDGFGFRLADQNNAISEAKMPNLRKILNKYPWTFLNADGESVGQEVGLVGNSEVGHMNLGGLKLVPQLSYQVTKSAEKNFDLDTKTCPDQLLDPKEFLTKRFDLDNSKTVHLVGLFSTGTIHSDLRHWIGSIEAAGLSGAEKIVLHLISDGRDSDRQSLVATWDYFTTEFADRLKPFEDKIFLGSLGGRFYAMDRDNNWDRVARGFLAFFNLENLGEIKELNYQDLFFISKEFEEFFQKKYDLKYTTIFQDFEFYRDNQLEKSVILGEKNLREGWQLNIWNPTGNRFLDYRNCLLEYTQDCYKSQIFDEHLKPKSIEDNGIKNGDTIWFMNFRTDRMKQLVSMFCDLNEEFKLNLNVLGMNDYGDGKAVFSDEKVDLSYRSIFKSKPVVDTLAERISKMSKTQLHIAETEKYNHVTYFLNGGQNKKWPGEDWILIPSNKVASHAEKPEMKAKEITDHLVEVLAKKSYDYLIVNYANPDMVGHTGDIAAGIESMEFLDNQLGRLFDLVEREGHNLIITADHGNIELIGETGDGKIDTEHNPNPVPLILITPNIDLNGLEKALEIANSNLIEPLNIKSLISELSRQKSLDTNQKWFTAKQIKDFLPAQDFPLWYAGVLLLVLGETVWG